MGDKKVFNTSKNMAIHQIEAPDGQIHEIEAPDDATPEQVMSFFQENYKPVQLKITDWVDDKPVKNAEQKGSTDYSQMSDEELLNIVRPATKPSGSNRPSLDEIFGNQSTALSPSDNILLRMNNSISNIGDSAIFAIVLFAIAIIFERYVENKKKKYKATKFNIFEGARRVVKLTQFGAIIILFSENRNNIELAVIYAAYWYLGIMLLSLIIGWIVRGFFNIPNWQDAKEKIIDK